MTGPLVRSPWDTALWMVQRSPGLKVFPLQPGSKIPVGGVDWTMAATSDQATVRAWKQMQPLSNYGVACGEPLSVLDLDVKKGDDGVLAMMNFCRDLDIPMPEDGFTVRTTTGGLHVYVSALLPTATGWLPGGDVRGVGGYVVGPGSLIQVPLAVDFKDPRNEAPYALLTYQIVDWRLPPATLPKELLDSIWHDRFGSSTGRTGSSNSTSDLPSTEWFLEHGFQPGSRSYDCYRVARRLFRQYGPDERVIVGTIRAIWEKTAQPDPFTWGEALKCVYSAQRKQAENDLQEQNELRAMRETATRLTPRWQ